MPESLARSSINTDNLFIMKNMYSETYKHFLVLYAVEMEYFNMNSPTFHYFPYQECMYRKEVRILSLTQYSKEELQEMSLIEVAYELLVEKKQAISFKQLMDELAQTLELSEEQVRAKIAQFYTDLNIDGRFLCLGDNQWGLRIWYPVDQVTEEIVNPVKAKKKKKAKKVVDELDGFDEIEELEEEFDDFDDDDDLLDDDDEIEDDGLLDDDDLDEADDDFDEDLVDEDLDEEIDEDLVEEIDDDEFEMDDEDQDLDDEEEDFDDLEEDKD